MQGLGRGHIVLMIVLLALLAVSGVWAITIWNAGSEVEMSAHGWIALGLGTFFSLLIGCGLMALMFFSHRSGHDELADPLRKKPPAE